MTERPVDTKRIHKLMKELAQTLKRSGTSPREWVIAVYALHTSFLSFIPKEDLDSIVSDVGLVVRELENRGLLGKHRVVGG